MKVFCKTDKLFFFEYRAEKFRLAVRKKSAGLSCCFLRLHGNFLKKIILKSFCSFSGHFFRWFPVIEQEKFGRPVKTAFFVSIKSFWKKLFWKTNEIFHHFQTLSWKFPASFRVYRRGCWNWILRVQGNILAKDSFISTFFHFWTLSDFCDQFSQKKERCCQNWTLSFNGDFRVQVSCKIYKLLFSWISSKKISAGFPKKVSGAFKLLSTSPWDNLKKIFYWKVFASFLDFFSDQFQ